MGDDLFLKYLTFATRCGSGYLFLLYACDCDERVFVYSLVWEYPQLWFSTMVLSVPGEIFRPCLRKAQNFLQSCSLFLILRDQLNVRVSKRA